MWFSFFLVNTLPKFYMSPFMALLHSVINKNQKAMPQRQDFAVHEAIQASTLWLGQSWHGLKRGENSPQETGGEFVGLCRSYLSLTVRPVKLGEKRRTKSLFLFWQCPSVSWMWLKWACWCEHIKWKGVWYEPSFKSAANGRVSYTLAVVLRDFVLSPA